MELTKRPRRLRGSENLRKMVRETRMDKSSLMYPMFVMEGENKEEEIPSMTGQYRYSLDRLPYKLEQLSKAGVGSVMFFGIPDHKDEVGSGAYDPEGIVQRALRIAKEKFPELYSVTDVCMCEYNSHGPVSYTHLSVLVSPKGYFEYEAAHGTVQRHYYRHLEGKETSTNSVATIFAWTGAIRKRGELDGNEALADFAGKLEKATLDTIESGKMTKDLALITSLKDVQVLNSKEFILAVKARLDELMA